MSAQTMAGGSGGFRAQWQPLGRTVEFKSYGYPMGDDWAGSFPMQPGSVFRDGTDRCTLLHFAPGRWLVPEPTDAVVAMLDLAVAAGIGDQIGVEGKWRFMAITGSGAARVLAATMACSTLLEGRECAATRLFDCPAIIARAAQGIDVWAQSSYAEDMLESLLRVSTQ